MADFYISSYIITYESTESTTLNLSYTLYFIISDQTLILSHEASITYTQTNEGTSGSVGTCNLNLNYTYDISVNVSSCLSYGIVPRPKAMQLLYNDLGVLVRNGEYIVGVNKNYFVTQVYPDAPCKPAGNEYKFKIYRKDKDKIKQKANINIYADLTYELNYTTINYLIKPVLLGEKHAIIPIATTKEQPAYNHTNVNGVYLFYPPLNEKKALCGLYTIDLEKEPVETTLHFNTLDINKRHFTAITNTLFPAISATFTGEAYIQFLNCIFIEPNIVKTHIGMDGDVLLTDIKGAVHYLPITLNLCGVFSNKTDTGIISNNRLILLGNLVGATTPPAVFLNLNGGDDVYRRQLTGAWGRSLNILDNFLQFNIQMTGQNIQNTNSCKLFIQYTHYLTGRTYNPVSNRLTTAYKWDYDQLLIRDYTILEATTNLNTKNTEFRIIPYKYLITSTSIGFHYFMQYFRSSQYDWGYNGTSFRPSLNWKHESDPDTPMVGHHISNVISRNGIVYIWKPKIENGNIIPYGTPYIKFDYDLHNLPDDYFLIVDGIKYVIFTKPTLSNNEVFRNTCDGTGAYSDDTSIKVPVIFNRWIEEGYPFEYFVGKVGTSNNNPVIALTTMSGRYALHQSGAAYYLIKQMPTSAFYPIYVSTFTHPIKGPNYILDEYLTETFTFSMLENANTDHIYELLDSPSGGVCGYLVNHVAIFTNKVRNGTDMYRKLVLYYNNKYDVINIPYSSISDSYIFIYGKYLIFTAGIVINLETKEVLEVGDRFEVYTGDQYVYSDLVIPYSTGFAPILYFCTASQYNVVRVKNIDLWLRSPCLTKLLTQKIYSDGCLPNRFTAGIIINRESIEKGEIPCSTASMSILT